MFVDRDADIDADTLVLDNEGGAAAAVEQLIAAGHRRIAHLYTTMEISTMRERKRGVDSALRDAGYLLSQAPDVAGVTSREGAASTVGHLLDAANPPSALFCANLEILLGTIGELVRRGRADIAVAGFSRPRAAELLPLPVTLVEADGFELGRAAANQLYRRIQKPDAPHRRTVIPTRLRQLPGVSLPELAPR